MPSDSLLRHSRNHSQPAGCDDQTAPTGAQPINYYPSPSLHGSLHLGQPCTQSQFAQSRDGATASIGGLPPDGSSLYSPPIEPGRTEAGPGHGIPDIRTPLSNDTWNAREVNEPYGCGSGAAPQIPGWFVNEEFDLDAFNLCILDSASNWLPRAYDDPVLSASYNVDQVVCPPPKEDLVKQHWFNFITPSTTGSVTPDVEPEGAQINDEYRDSLAHKLHQTVPSSPLPSPDAMVSHTPR